MFNHSSLTVAQFLSKCDLPTLEKRMLLQEVLQVSRVWLITHDTTTISADSLEQLKLLVNRRKAGEPMAYLLGRKEFMGLNFTVNEEVLIPRPETELLVESIINLASDKKNFKVLDLGTGSGAIALSIKHFLPQAQVYATDFSQAALVVAKTNAQQLSLDVAFIHSDWFASIQEQGFDCIVSNPPYIHPTDHHLQKDGLNFEPVDALTDHCDGLSDIRSIIKNASNYLKLGGSLWIEHGWDQANDVRNLLNKAGFKQVQSHKDIAGIERLSCGLV